MNEKKIVAPKGMVQAGATGWLSSRGSDGQMNPMEVSRSVLIESLRWLSEYPIVPSHEVIQSMLGEPRCPLRDCPPSTQIRYVATEWQRRMFLAPEPEIPEAVKDLLLSESSLDREAYFRPGIYNQRILEAFRRGKETQR